MHSPPAALICWMESKTRSPLPQGSSSCPRLGSEHPLPCARAPGCGPRSSTASMGTTRLSSIIPVLHPPPLPPRLRWGPGLDLELDCAPSRSAAPRESPSSASSADVIRVRAREHRPRCPCSQDGSKVTVGGWEENSPAPHWSLLLGALLCDGVEGGGGQGSLQRVHGAGQGLAWPPHPWVMELVQISADAGARMWVLGAAAQSWVPKPPWHNWYLCKD